MSRQPTRPGLWWWYNGARRPVLVTVSPEAALQKTLPLGGVWIKEEECNEGAGCKERK